MGNTTLFRLTLALATTTLLMLSGTLSHARVHSQKAGESTTFPHKTTDPKTVPNRTKEATICSHQLPYYWQGMAYTTTGTYSIHIVNEAGDYETTLLLTVVPSDTWFPDADGDGYGNGNQPVQLCQASGSYVRNGSDCDDSDPTIKQAVEYFTDADNDGFGSDQSVLFCTPTPPPGFSAVNTDCDDHNASQHPNSANPCRGIQNEMNVPSVAFFPNPGSGIFSLNRMQVLGNIHLKVVNLQGIQIWEGNVDEASNGRPVLDLQAQPAGIYNVQCSAPGFTQNLRLVIF